MFSEALKIADKNTVKYMMEELQDKLNESEEERKQAENKQKQAEEELLQSRKNERKLEEEIIKLRAQLEKK